MFRLKYNVKLTRFISATRASFIRATFEKTMIWIEAGGIGNIDAQISKRKGEMDFCVEARTIDKVRIKNSRDSKNRVAGVEILRNVYGWALSLDWQNRSEIRFVSELRRIYRWCIYVRRIRTASFGRFPSNGSLKVRFSCQFFARESFSNTRIAFIPFLSTNRAIICSS